MVVLALLSGGTSILLSIVDDGLIYIPPKSVLEFLFSSHLTSVYFLDDSHSNWVDEKSQCCFDLHFLYG
jgi:hypothetical protein